MSNCPECGSMRTEVVTTSTKTKDGTRVRRRHCLICDHRWYTIQPPERVIDSSRLKWVRFRSREIRILEGGK